jgi:hypothetical protein
MIRRLSALQMPLECRHFSLKSHYASPFGAHLRDWNSDQQPIAYVTCELIIFQFDYTCRQLGVNIARLWQNIGHAKRVEEPVENLM